MGANGGSGDVDADLTESAESHLAVGQGDGARRGQRQSALAIVAFSRGGGEGDGSRQRIGEGHVVHRAARRIVDGEGQGGLAAGAYGVWEKLHRESRLSRSGARREHDNKGQDDTMEHSLESGEGGWDEAGAIQHGYEVL